jgi:hypothetical protein
MSRPAAPCYWIHEELDWLSPLTCSRCRSILNQHLSLQRILWKRYCQDERLHIWRRSISSIHFSVARSNFISDSSYAEGSSGARTSVVGSIPFSPSNYAQPQSESLQEQLKLAFGFQDQRTRALVPKAGFFYLLGLGDVRKMPSKSLLPVPKIANNARRGTPEAPDRYVIIWKHSVSGKMG